MSKYTKYMKYKKSTNGDIICPHTICQIYKIINKGNKLLNCVTSYFDKYTYIMAWKARFKFNILEPLSY